MSGIHHVSTRARGLTLGLAAAALAITTLVTPAHAELNDNVGDLAVTDMQVTKKSLEFEGNEVKGTFVVRNNGPRNVQFTLKQRVYQKTIGSNAPAEYYAEPAYPLYLAPGNTLTVPLTCTPLPGKYCTAVTVEAAYSLDLNQSNNTATYQRTGSGSWQ